MTTTPAHTFKVSCDCATCETNAAKIGRPFPLTALIRPLAAQGLGITERNAHKASKTHRMVWSAFDPSQVNLSTERRFAIPAGV